MADSLKVSTVHSEQRQRSIWVRLGWLVAIWAMSVAALAVVAGLLRWWLL